MNRTYSYKTFFQKLYQKQTQKFAFHADSREDALLWQQKFREAVKDTLGLKLLAQMAEELSAEENAPVLLEETQETGYRRMKYVMQTLPDVFMPFYMLVPDRVDASHPARAMLVIPAHGANKNTVCGVGDTPEEKEKIRSTPDECYGREFARKGYVVFCPDPPGFGKRTEPLSMEDASFLFSYRKNSLDSSCKDLAQTAEAFGLSLTALELWDLMKLLDFSCKCGCIAEDHDGKRIGCAGFSGGGQYTMWLAALDSRIRTAVVSGYIHSYYESLLECHLCPCNYAPRLWTLGDICDICSLIAPRPLFAENGTEDIENGPKGISDPKEQINKIRKSYALFEAEEKLAHVTPCGPHKWYGTCYEFVDLNL